MTVHAALPPIEECTDPFRVGAELDARLWLAAIHLYDRRNRLFGGHPYAEPTLGPTFRQQGASDARPNLAFLRSTVVGVEPDARPKTERFGPDWDRTKVRVDAPLPLEIDFRRLQQGYGAIPTEAGLPISALGFLGASARSDAGSHRVRVDAVLALDLEPDSPTFGAWRSDEVWREGAVDVSNLGETTVLARLTLLEGWRIVEAWP